MTFDEYQEQSRKTAIYPKNGQEGIYFLVMGLCGEAGEVAEKVKKVMRDDQGCFNRQSRESVFRELGDLLWYASQLATELDFRLDDVADANLAKLQSRKERGTLKGSGDGR